MSKVLRDADHAARLLQGELARIASKRERTITKANGDFQLELIQAVHEAPPSTLKLVRQVLREELQPQGLQGPSQYDLDVTLTTRVEELGVRKDATSSRANSASRSR